MSASNIAGRLQAKIAASDPGENIAIYMKREEAIVVVKALQVCANIADIASRETNS